MFSLSVRGWRNHFDGAKGGAFSEQVEQHCERGGPQQVERVLDCPVQGDGPAGAGEGHRRAQSRIFRE